MGVMAKTKQKVEGKFEKKDKENFDRHKKNAGVFGYALIVRTH